VVAERYKVTRVIARGGMGLVLEAIRRDDGARVVVKVLHPELDDDPVGREHLAREADALAGLQHPRVVQLLERGVTPGGQPYLVLEWAEGRTLRELLAERGRLPLDRCLWIMDGLLDAVEAVHARGVLHGDLKPENVMVTDEQGVRVLDFGAATFARARRERRGEVYGTPGYLAPELLMGHPPSPASDLYACGVVLFQTLTGRLPYDGTVAMDILRDQVERAPPRASMLCDEIDDRMDALLARTLAVLPGNRFESAREMRVALARTAWRRRSPGNGAACEPIRDVAVTVRQRAVGRAPSTRRM
jgi:serine/threonine-protein kinase